MTEHEALGTHRGRKMRIRHTWEGTRGSVTIRVEQWFSFPFSKRLCMYANGKLLAAEDGAGRLVGETGDDDGRRDVVATIRPGWSKSEDWCTVTHDGRPVGMHVLQTTWLSAQPQTLKGMLVFAPWLLSEISENRWIEYSLFAVLIAAFLISDTIPVYPSKRSVAVKK